ncbi:hypothetical protein RND71_006449 [Anisodus tanguticus]|uniref:Uncharacterized protein n=1 Tax=Anisodus tanguticus TaxID=243964 RepID=A0AAE1VNN2_9SOLA|nr:hypothetical protein RND71_006449 [Anisodus tanguticus]
MISGDIKGCRGSSPLVATRAATKVENELPAAFQNDDISHVNEVDRELETEMEHPEHILEEVEIEEVEENDENETSDEEEWSDEEENEEN